MPFDLLHRALIGTLPYVPRPLVWRISRRYIAGTTLADAYRAVTELNAAGCAATIDVLGEDSTGPAQVEQAQALYLDALDGIRAGRLDCNISVKLSEMGLRFDAGLCRETVARLVEAAAGHGNFVRIDMEDSSVTSTTLDIYRSLRRRYDNVGAVIQSCLRRSAADVEELLAGGKTNIRLCKGIYIEPEDIAYRDAEEIRDAYRQLLEQLFAGGAMRVGIATHDPALVEHAEALIRQRAIPRERYEFQMLLGVAGGLRNRLVADGHPLRVYVPFGELWFRYSLRRLRENPDMVGHIVSNLFR